MVVGFFFREWLSYVERRKRHEDVPLEEGDQELEEPERNRHDSKKSSGILWEDHLPDVDDDRDEDSSDENIEKQTHREWTDTDKLSSKVQPTDEHADVFLSDSISVKIEQIVLEVLYWSLHPDSGNLSDEDNRQWEDKGRRKIRIDRPQIGSKPLIFRNEHEPIEDKSKEIPDEYHHHKTSEEPEVSFSDFFISDEADTIGKYSANDIDPKGSHTRHLVRRNRHIKKSDNQSKNPHK